MIYYSTENLKTETLDRDTRDRILSLSYEKFFNDSVSTENEITVISKSIEDINKDYSTVAKALKEQYHSMSYEDEATQEKTKVKFFANIKNWFIRIWAAIVTIFEKIVVVVQSIIKSLILYIKKHLLLKNSLYTKLSSDSKLAVAFNKPDDKMTKNIERVINGKVKIPSIAIENSSADWKTIYNTLKNTTLMDFMRTKIVVDNKKSALNTERYETLLNTIKAIDSAPTSEFTAESKLTVLSDNITEFTAESVLYGEADTDGKLSSIYGEKSNSQAYIIELLKNGNVKSAANQIVFNTASPERVTMYLNDFLGIPENSSVQNALSQLREILADYEYLGNLVIGKGGYCEIMTEVLKRYAAVANNDSKHIKTIKNEIIKLMQTIDSSDGNGQKVTNRCKRFTNLIVRIQKIKNDFILLRQNVLGNVLTCYSTFDRALSAVINPINPKDLLDKDVDAITNNDIVGGKSGKDPLEGYYDDEPVTAEGQLN